MLSKKTTYTISEFLEMLEAKNRKANYYTYQERSMKRYAAECGTILTIPKDLTIKRYLVFVGACFINFKTVYADQLVPANSATLLPFLQFSLRLSILIAAAKILVKILQFIFSNKTSREELVQFIITTGKSIAELVCMLLLPQVFDDLMVLLPLE